MIDITIVDGESDLSVYVTDKEVGEEADEGTAGCCGPLSKDNVPQDQDTKECCGSSVSWNTVYRCSYEANTYEQSSEVSRLGLADIDINEWVGEWDTIQYLELILTVPLQGSFKIFAVKI